MRIYFQFVDYELWRIIIKCSKTPSKKVKEVNVPKSESEWNEDNLKMLQSNAKAMNFVLLILMNLIIFLIVNEPKKYEIDFR